MDSKDVAMAIYELISLNSNLEAREGDTIFFDVIEKIVRSDTCISIVFANGRVFDISVEERK